MSTLLEALHAQARTVAGTAGSVNEDLFAALCVMDGTTPATETRHLSGLLTLIPGGLPALLADPTLLTGGAASPSLNFSLAANSQYVPVLAL